MRLKHLESLRQYAKQAGLDDWAICTDEIFEAAEKDGESRDIGSVIITTSSRQTVRFMHYGDAWDFIQEHAKLQRKG